MTKNILVCYKTVTGFTRRYAEWIAQKTGARLIESREVDAETIAPYDVVVFGGRFHAGKVDGLDHIKQLMAGQTDKELVLFATGAMPPTARSDIEQAWQTNLNEPEMKQLPHYYFPAGLCYEKMPWSDRLMMKVFIGMNKRKLKKAAQDCPFDEAGLEMITRSFDISKPEYIEPLISRLQETEHVPV